MWCGGRREGVWGDGNWGDGDWGDGNGVDGVVGLRVGLGVGME